MDPYLRQSAVSGQDTTLRPKDGKHVKQPECRNLGGGYLVNDT